MRSPDRVIEAEPSGMDCYPADRYSSGVSAFKVAAMALWTASTLRLAAHEQLLDRIEIGAVRPQEGEPRAGGPDGVADGSVFVGAEIVEHDDVARLQGFDELGFDIEAEGLAVDGPIEYPRRVTFGSRSTSRSTNSRCFPPIRPVAVHLARCRTAQTPLARRPLDHARHRHLQRRSHFAVRLPRLKPSHRPLALPRPTGSCVCRLLDPGHCSERKQAKAGSKRYGQGNDERETLHREHLKQLCSHRKTAVRRRCFHR